MTTLWQSCIHHLGQARELAERIPSEQLSAPHAHCFGGTIGQHLRHCLDHFERARLGLETGLVDYDARARGTIEETDAEAAVRRLDQLIAWFETHQATFENAAPVRVKVDCGLEEGGSQEQEGGENSTIGRELQFLVSHTLHHFAIIAIMCEAQGIPLAPGFGVAPSTLRYEASISAVEYPPGAGRLDPFSLHDSPAS